MPTETWSSLLGGGEEEGGEGRREYGGWLRNPAPAKGWLKPYKSCFFHELVSGFRNHPPDISDKI